MPKEKCEKNTSDIRKNKLILSGLKVFCKKGYDGATINDIVKNAKCSHGLFYHYFDNKKQLFDAVCEMRGNDMMHFIDMVLQEDMSYVDKLIRLVEYTFNNMKKDEIFAYKYYFFVSRIFDKAEKNILPKQEGPPPHLKMQEFFKSGIEKGDFHDRYSPKDCARLYNCIIQGATLNFLLYPKELKKSFNFPPIQFVADIFKKEI